MGEIQDLINRQQELHEQVQSLIAGAKSEKRDLSDDERRQIKDFQSQFDSLEEEIGLLNTANAQGSRLTDSMGRQTEPEGARRQPANNDADDDAGNEPPRPAPITRTRPTNFGNQPNRNGNGAPRQQPDPRLTANFRSMGEFSQAVFNARGGHIDPRLEMIRNAPTTYGQESVGADGGFAVPPAFRTAIMEKVMGENSLLSLTDNEQTSSNTLTVPIDETTPWGTTGVKAYWTAEGALKTQSKPSLGETTVKLHKLAALVPVTDELLEDAPALDNYIRRRSSEAITWEINRAIVSGTGVGQPLGILNSGALISVAKEAGPQAADTLVYANLVKMWSRMPDASRQRAVWIANQTIEPQLLQMVVTGAAQPIYMNGGNAAGTPFRQLLGLRIVYTEAAPPLGDLGDIILADMSGYLSVTKVGGVRTDVSIHLYFDYDVTAFRFVMRIGGRPWFNSPITANDGTTTYSPFVALAERA